MPWVGVQNQSQNRQTVVTVALGSAADFGLFCYSSRPAFGGKKSGRSNRILLNNLKKGHSLPYFT